MQRDAPLSAGACFWHWGCCHRVCSEICRDLRMAGRACREAGRRIWGLLGQHPWGKLHPGLLPALGRGAGWTGTGDPAVAWLGPEDLLSFSEAAVASPAPWPGWRGPSIPRSWVHAVAQPWQHHRRLHGTHGLGRVASAGRCQAGGRAGTPWWGAHCAAHLHFRCDANSGCPPLLCPIAPHFTPTAACCNMAGMRVSPGPCSRVSPTTEGSWDGPPAQPHRETGQ